MATKRSLVLAAAILAAAFFLTPFAHAADPLMPTGNGGEDPDNGIQPFDPDPANRNSATNKFMTYGVDEALNTVPVKTLRITNNTTQTVFPIMRDPNSNVLKADPLIGLYDPYDLPNKEYRGYIGYAEGGKYYFGLKPGESILVTVPLVFWNGARIGIGTDSEYLVRTAPPNPLRYDVKSLRTITAATASDDTIPNGVVMWYRADIAQAPNDDTEDQLAEWTFRDHGYLSNPKITLKTHTEIPDNQLVTLVNYDVSNVDNLYLPLAMAANDVWVLPQSSGPDGVNRTGWEAGSHPDVFAWTGATNSIDFLQTKIREFTVAPNALLGQYFGGQGWPFYNIPNGPGAPIKIPSGANIFAQSPIKAVPSSYGNGEWQNDKYMLSSGGTDSIAATIGWAGGTPDNAGSTTLHVNLAEAEKIAFVRAGFHVEGRPAPAAPNPIQTGTTVVSIDAPTGTVVLSKPLAATSEGSAYSFTRPVDDYASEAMIRLWYSWAEYYRANWNKTDETKGAPAQTTISASIDAMTATLHFNEPHPELVLGMAVTGAGLDNAQTEVDPQQGKSVILKIAGDHRSVILSQVVATAATNSPYTFKAPQALLYTPAAESDPGFPLITFDFSQDPPAAWHDPYKFSQQVYLIMASMNQIGLSNNDSVSKYMQDIVGANMGFIFTNDAKLTVEGNMVTSMIRDMIKSVLRGVTDFTEFPDEVENGVHLAWYPDPAVHRGGQPFNVYNLDPFVWFVHVQLGFSGYGFSVDDDTADVGAGGASHLQLSVTGTGGLKNTQPWTIQAQYGPVENVVIPYSGPAIGDVGDSPYAAITSVADTTPIRVTTTDPHKLANGTKIVVEQVLGQGAANGTFRVGNVTRKTFDLFDAETGLIPVAAKGTYISGGRWGYPLHAYVDSGDDAAKVFYRVQGDDPDGLFQGTFVSVNGVDRNPITKKPFRVWRLGRKDVGRILLDADLTDAAGSPLPAGNYSFTFFGVAEVSPAPPTVPVVNSTSGEPNAVYVQQLRNRITRAQKIEDPEKRALVLERLRAWLKIVRRGIDPDSREGRLLRKLVNARTIADPDRRQAAVDRIKDQLDDLRN